MDDVAIIGVGLHPFGRHGDKSAFEMGADAEDLALTVHPHPTLSETVALAAEAFEGTITDLYLPRRGKD